MRKDYLRPFVTLLFGVLLCFDHHLISANEPFTEKASSTAYGDHAKLQPSDYLLSMYCASCVVQPRSYLFCQVNGTKAAQAILVSTSNSTILRLVYLSFTSFPSVTWFVTFSASSPGLSTVKVTSGFYSAYMVNCGGYITVMDSVTCDQKATLNTTYGNNCPPGSAPDATGYCRCQTGKCSSGMCITDSLGCDFPTVVEPNSLLQCYPSNSISLLYVGSTSNLLGNGISNSSTAYIDTIRQVSSFGTFLTIRDFFLFQIDAVNFQTSVVISAVNVNELLITRQFSTTFLLLLFGNLNQLTLSPSAVLTFGSTSILMLSTLMLLPGSQTQISLGATVLTSAVTNIYGSLTLSSMSYFNFTSYVYMNSTCSGTGTIYLSGAFLATEGVGSRTCGIDVGLPMNVSNFTTTSRRFRKLAVLQQSQSVWAPCGLWQGSVRVRTGQRVSVNLNCSSASGGPLNLANTLAMETHANLSFDGIDLAIDPSHWANISSLQFLGPVTVTYTPAFTVEFYIIVASVQKFTNKSVAVSVSPCAAGCNCGVTIQNGLMVLHQNCPPGPSDVWIVGAVVGAIAAIIVLMFVYCARRCQNISPFSRPTKRDISMVALPPEFAELLPQPSPTPTQYPPAPEPQQQQQQQPQQRQSLQPLQLNPPPIPLADLRSPSVQGSASQSMPPQPAGGPPKVEGVSVGGSGGGGGGGGGPKARKEDTSDIPDPFQCSSVIFDVPPVSPTYQIVTRPS